MIIINYLTLKIYNWSDLTQNAIQNIKKNQLLPINYTSH